MTTEKNYKFSVLEASLRYPDEIVKYMEEDEDVQGMKCFEKFADAKEFAKEFKRFAVLELQKFRIT